MKTLHYIITRDWGSIHSTQDCIVVLCYGMYFMFCIHLCLLFAVMYIILDGIMVHVASTSCPAFRMFKSSYTADMKVFLWVLVVWMNLNLNLKQHNCFLPSGPCDRAGQHPALHSWRAGRPEPGAQLLDYWEPPTQSHMDPGQRPPVRQPPGRPPGDISLPLYC